MHPFRRYMIETAVPAAPTLKFRKVEGDEWEAKYISSDDRFVIQKVRVAGSRNGYWKAEWQLYDTWYQERETGLDNMRQAREIAQDTVDAYPTRPPEGTKGYSS